MKMIEIAECCNINSSTSHSLMPHFGVSFGIASFLFLSYFCRPELLEFQVEVVAGVVASVVCRWFPLEIIVDEELPLDIDFENEPDGLEYYIRKLGIHDLGNNSHSRTASTFSKAEVKPTESRKEIISEIYYK
ncbi:13079_t:CDS:2 [Ambispora gerdemannii]|uniref:13079_t:CDS:1 n=1 Tax=Ambispora gerdemannii TaxID=144530 RepID=A0A9N8ZRU4_9GLOM|nr:13079_t:CDS:2 [Ambispora gerdemannii]